MGKVSDTTIVLTILILFVVLQWIGFHVLS